MAIKLFRKSKAELDESPREERGVVKESPKTGQFGILLRPHITEKASRLQQAGRYIFQVLSRSNKSEVKRAVEGMYGVKVESVHMINIPPKRRRLGRFEGWKKGIKKAVVKLKEGQKIDIGVQ